MHVANIKPKRSWTELEDLEEVQYGYKIKLSITHYISLDMHGAVLDIHD